MQEVQTPLPADTPLPMLEEIRRGGRLAMLFRQAANNQAAGTRQLLRDRRSASLLQDLLEDARDRQSDRAATNSLTVLHECAAGCNACCQAAFVELTPLEALAVASHLQQSYTPEQLQPIVERLKDREQKRWSWTASEATHSVTSCALLGENGLCQAYEMRPLVCAGVFSFSRKACEQAYPGPSETNVPLDRPAKAWSMGLSGGLQKALVAAGLDGNLYELNSAVLCALQTEQAFERWLRREDIFAECHCTDAHSAPRKSKAKIRIDSSHKKPAEDSQRQPLQQSSDKKLAQQELRR